MQQCCKLHLGVKQWPYIVESQYKHINTCLYNMVIVTALGVPTCQEGTEGSNQLESIAPLKVPFAGCSVLMLFCWHYSHRLPLTSVWLTQEDVSQLFDSLSQYNGLICSTDPVK